MIYLDNASTTKVCRRAVQAMEPYLNEMYGNPSGVYQLSKMAKKIVDEARENIAKALHTASTIFFLPRGNGIG